MRGIIKIIMPFSVMVALIMMSALPAGAEQRVLVQVTKAHHLDMDCRVKRRGKLFVIFLPW